MKTADKIIKEISDVPDTEEIVDRALSLAYDIEQLSKSYEFVVPGVKNSQLPDIAREYFRLATRLQANI